MRLKNSRFMIPFSIAVFASSVFAAEGNRPHAGMMRFPGVSATHIAFVYADDIWTVPKEGGAASPLASPPGMEMFPRFSPDGKTIAFSANYDGNTDLYTVALPSGVPRRLTHHSSGERLCDWSGDNSLIFSMRGLAGLVRQDQLFTVSREGGLPHRLPVPYGGYGAVSPDGEWLAYTPFNRDFRTWKRYRGGLASDIWLFHLTEHTSKKITDWEGTDTIPMWHGKTVYYLSDADPSHRLNIWAYDTETGNRRQITRFTEYDVKWPSNGPGSNGEGEIVFQLGPELRLLNLASEQSRAVEVIIPGAKPDIRPQPKDVNGLIENRGISPTGQRVVVEARGDIWSLPAAEGSLRNLTRTAGAAERDPAWSPDGRWIAYFSDETGEYQLTIREAEIGGETKTLTSFEKGFLFNPVWSPDSKWIAFETSENEIHLCNAESGEVKFVDKNEMMGRIPSFNVSWSHDSNWIAYGRRTDNTMQCIRLYNLLDGTIHTVTSGMFNDSRPVFGRKGDYLFFASQREIAPASVDYDDMGYDFIYHETEVLHAVPLRADVPNPFAAKSDEETWTEDKAGAGGENGNGATDGDESKACGAVDCATCADCAAAGDPECATTCETQPAGDVASATVENATDAPLIIDIDGFERRAFRLPVPRGWFSSLMVNGKNQLLYIRAGEKNTLLLFDLSDKERKEQTVLEDVGFALMSADGKKLLVPSGGRTAVVDAAPGQKIEKTVPESPMKTVIEPREEWRQLYTDAWRIMRDFFFDPNLHGVDWEVVRKQYEPMLADCASRRDAGYVIGEMISELNASHTYYGGGDVESGPSVSAGYMGVDFEKRDGLYAIAKMHRGAEWDTDARNPLEALPEAAREQFVYLFAVNGIPVDTDKDPWAAFQGLAGEVATLTVGATADIGGATHISLKLLSQSDELELRYRGWIESNRAYVEEKTDGKVGYIYVPNTGGNGQSDLYRQFYGQMAKDALIIDERWNAGGQMPDRFVQLLNRPALLHLFKRHEKDWRVPEVSHQGPKCMLINGAAGSGGDLFPFLFKEAAVGKLIGTRTWGGVIGIFGNPPLIDGARLTAPNITMYENDGTLTMEGHGVEPDIEVIDDPALMVDGGDPQLDAAIEHMLEELEKNPYTPPARPPYPDRSGMGIREDDK